MYIYIYIYTYTYIHTYIYTYIVCKAALGEQLCDMFPA